ncbi:hypothetical protein GALMADRAFT_148539 [Galerina marginata CBS 339.88]|uniref:Uncharacterized protein n=1 Tax=Galerina marginata (strain CBS 339.88) TaxID=685588 RepID=A0A067S6V4_GALM3|nr:hypothetical protein GALMADRAFT_148539 [Galerina marginata CBS 339.88]
MKALKDITGHPAPDSTDLARCKLPTLKSICLECKLPVAKSGGTLARPTSVKKDYINAIVQRMHLLSAESNSMEAVIQKRKDSKEAGMPASTNKSSTRESSGINYSSPMDDVDPASRQRFAAVNVRLFKRASDYHALFESEKQFSYVPYIGIPLHDLAKEFLLDGECEIIYPLNFKPFSVPNGVLNPCLLPMLTGTNSYIRITRKLNRRI